MLLNKKCLFGMPQPFPETYDTTHLIVVVIYPNVTSQVEYFSPALDDQNYWLNQRPTFINNLMYI